MLKVSADQAGYWMAFPMSSPSMADIICSPKAKGGDLLTSTDDAPVKIRKPYTITKQRERWTEEEHQKFLDALKLHGRAWRRIEEYIGTKTAVQIRSHAQKFFSKLEREASLGGPLATPGSGEIEIPPPRPKRKPSHPYPKKACGAFSGSPSFEEDSKSPPAVQSAFTPLESGGTGASASKTPLKKFRSSAASLRLFGQNVVPGSEKVDAETELMESTGSPRSQVSGETEEMSGISPVISNTGSGVWDQTASDSQPHETVGASSGINSQPWDQAASVSQPHDIVGALSGTTNPNEKNAASNESCYLPWQPSPLSLGGHHATQFSACAPPCWQGLVPPSFAHATSEDVNTAAAIAAATYAVASAWQAIQGALANASNEWPSANAGNEVNTGIVYSPIAMPAATRQPAISKPQSPDLRTHGCGKRKQGHKDAANRNEDEGNNVYGEESAAECCSGLTDTSRLSSYESNDEGGPAKKCCMHFCDHNMHSDKEAPESLRDMKCERIVSVEKPLLGSEGSDISHENNGAEAILSNSTDDDMDGPSNKARIEGSSVNGLLQQEIDTAKISILTNGCHPIDLIIQACGLDSHVETNQSSLKEKGTPKESTISNNKEIVSSSTLSARKALISKECINKSSLHDTGAQTGGNVTCIEPGHLFMFKAGATLSSRYSGTGFVPYKKSTIVESSSKHED